MDYVITSIVVTDSVLFNRGGDIRRWAESVERKFTANAIAAAPSGLKTGRIIKSRANAAFPAGSLAASISGEVTQVGPRQLQTIVLVDVPYALHVIYGTKGTIFAKSARDARGSFRSLRDDSGAYQGGLYLPPGAGFPAGVRQRVKGQTADPFLQDAFDKTALTHSSLRGQSIVG